MMWWLVWKNEKNILDYDSSGVESQDGVVYSSYNNAGAVRWCQYTVRIGRKEEKY